MTHPEDLGHPDLRTWKSLDPIARFDPVPDEPTPVHFQGVLSRPRRDIIREVPGVHVEDVQDGPLPVHVGDAQGDEGVLHPKGTRRRTFKNEEHALVLAQFLAEHQAHLLGRRRVGHFHLDLLPPDLHPDQGKGRLGLGSTGPAKEEQPGQEQTALGKMGEMISLGHSINGIESLQFSPFLPNVSLQLLARFNLTPQKPFPNISLMKKHLTVFFLLLFGAYVLTPSLEAATPASTPTAKKKTKAKSSAKKKSTSTQEKEEAPKTLEPQPVVNPKRAQIAEAYNYALKLYAAQRFEEAKDTFKKIALVSQENDLVSNSLYYFSQCAFRTEDFNGCVKSMNLLAEKYPRSEAIQKGHLQRFCLFLFNQSASIQPTWDFLRFKERNDPEGKPVWKESVPPGMRIKRINFKLAFGAYRALSTLNPNDPTTQVCRQKLEAMLAVPLTLVWVDEKAPSRPWGHAGDFVTNFSLNERKDFSKVICDRLFYDWQTEKLHQFLDMHDDVRNLKPRFVASTKKLPTDPEKAKAAKEDPTFELTLSKLFQIAGYDPYQDSFTNVIEAPPAGQL